LVVNKKRLQVMMSGAEEFVPPNVSKGQLAERLAKAMVRKCSLNIPIVP
jgi:hypothetical protein